MDKLDVRIIDVLQKAGNLTQAELAAKVNSSPSTCLRRVKDLKKNGYLQNCVYLTNPKQLGRGLCAFIVISIKNHNLAKRKKFASKLQKLSAITMAYGVCGESDAILIGHFENMEEYQMVFDKLFDDEAFTCKTFFVSETYKESTAIPCDVMVNKLQY